MRRPSVEAREPLDSARLDPASGSSATTGRRGAAGHPRRLGSIRRRSSPSSAPGSCGPSSLTQSRWSLAGDQLYVDLDLRADTLPAGSRLAIGDAVIEISAKPHTGCEKFAARFGIDALAWISTPVGKAHRMRGLNARIVRGGEIAVGDVIRRV